MDKSAQKRNPKYDPVRAACIMAIGMVLDRGWKTDEAISEVLSGGEFNELDRRFMLQLCHGVVKMRRRLDFTYSFFLQKPNARVDPVTRNILRLGLYQLIFTDRIPAGAAVSESVNLARGLVHHSRGSFVNAILRNYLRTPEKVVYPDKYERTEEYLANYYSYPDWFVKYCLSEFGPERTEQLLIRGNQPPQLTYRINRLQIHPDELTRELEKHKIDYSPGKYLKDYYYIRKQGLPLEKELIETGKVYIQDESAGISVRLVNPRPKETFLDLCSAPGGKATYAAALMHNSGRITSVDINLKRLETLVENARRLGIRTIAPVVCDVLDFKGPAAGKVLLDAPCSGWGVVGRHSDLRWSKSREDSMKLARTQGHLLRHAADLLSPGGTLVYSTCTIIRDENDQVIEEFLLDRPDFALVRPGSFVARELVNERGFVKTYPIFDNIDGSFCVALKKKLGSDRKMP